MPNLRGPDERRRRLFANVISSILLYGAPVWRDELVTSKLQVVLGRLERSVAQRTISAYRTVSSNAAMLLARIPPLRFMAPMRKRMYMWLKRFKEEENAVLSK
ncbi:reverse transcriptase [Lasius niger]|uniref:Reverse transcriptase n=1 Tax=Lasius niger TaxID=67767 RepID=A0A0J7K0W4_LASNI|nr:reverse transcriptase [Lasius niger]